MASLGKDLKGQDAGKEFHKIRITLTTRKVKAVEKVSNDLIASAKAKGVAVRGPVRLPTKNLRINTRKSPNGEGSKTYDAFELRIHKRIIDMRCNSDELRQIANIGIDPSVEIEVTVAQ